MPRNRADLLNSATVVAPISTAPPATATVIKDPPGGRPDDGSQDPIDAPESGRVSARAATPRGPPSWLDDNDRVLSADETARLLGISTFTLLRKRRCPNADGLPFVQLSSKRLGYRLGDIRSYLQARRVGALITA